MNEKVNLEIKKQTKTNNIINKSGQEETSVYRTRYFVFSLLFFVSAAFLGALLDIVTKNWIFSLLGLPGEYKRVEQDGIYWLLPDIFGFQTSLNEGGIFGMWQGQSFPLAILSCVALAGICLWIFFVVWRSCFMVFTLSLIAAGILGNLYDRLGFHALSYNGDFIYAVRDWIVVMIGNYHWPNFNLADTFLVCGTILILLQPFFEWLAKKFSCSDKKIKHENIEK
ncbi:MAG: signal peptidase II [Planctomycetaceae bacterium]|jgi:signal peptidase II|nr:signal peptidase II [Planctomycetaceae bacterium]